jgi:hypothetical protein
MSINIKMRLFLPLCAAIALALTSVGAYGQGMCIQDPIEVRQVKGQVFFEWDGKKRPLNDVTVEVLERINDENRLVTRTVTDTEGHFYIPDLKPGLYWLVTKHYAVIGISVEMRVKATRADRKASNNLIIFVLSADPSKTCGGGDVKIVKQ